MHSHLCIKQEDMTEEMIVNAARTSMSSKIISGEAHLFARMAVDAMKRVGIKDDRGKYRYPVAAVAIKKVHGKSVAESELINGYAIQLGRASQQMPRVVNNARVACLDLNLQKFRMAVGITVQCNDVNQLSGVRKQEMEITKNRIQKILDAGANVIFTTKGIDDFAMKYFVESGVLGVRRVEKNDMKKIARMTGASILTTLADMEEGEELMKESDLGFAESVYEEHVGDWEFIFVKEGKCTKAQTILIRGANDMMTEEVERSLHDSLCVVKRVLESGTLVAGGGAVEVALGVFLEDKARTMEGREQQAVTEFAEALQVIPKTLALNAALDAIDLLAKLRVVHAKSQSSEEDTTELK